MSETLDQLIARNAKVAWSCDVGNVMGHVGYHGGEVDLLAMREAVGGSVILSNRRAPCREPGCPGRVEFKDVTSLWARRLDTITDKDAAYWAYNHAHRTELEAMGWRVERGYWKPPDAEKARPPHEG